MLVINIFVKLKGKTIRLEKTMLIFLNLKTEDLVVIITK